MRRLRVLTVLLGLSACGTPAPAPAPEPAPAPATPAATAPAPPAKPAPLKIGETVDALGPYAQVWPTAQQVTFGAKPTILFFWSTSTPDARDQLVVFDAWVKEQKLRDKADVYAIAGVRDSGTKPADLRDMAILLGVQEVPVIADPDFALANRLNVQNSPEIAVIGTDGKLLARGIRSLDQGRLQSANDPTQMDARTYLKAVAEQKTGPTIPRTYPYYPSDALVGHLVPDLTLPEFSALGPGKGKQRSIRSLISGKRPAVLIFFSSTCKHCQVDVPQIVALEKADPDAWDVIGITDIRSAQHRQITDQYLKQQGVTFPVLEDAGAFNDVMNVTSTPTDFYVAKDGTIGEISYYQHKDLPTEWGKIADRLASVPHGTPIPTTEEKGWAFPLQLASEKGENVDAATFEGKPTILHFWATWCAPCREELPKLLARIPELEQHGHVALITVEKDASPLAKYRAQTGFSFTTLLNPHGGLADQLEFSRSVPRTYILDAHGKIADLLQGSYAWDDDEKFSRVLGDLR
jgi:thiol-disulfide isomerase/thioredoxin